MITVVLSIGSNFGDRHAHVAHAIEWLTNILGNTHFSLMYETQEIHGKGTPYINAVIKGTTEKSFNILNEELKKYEIASGRDDASRKRGEVPIDIDIVCWDGLVIRPRDYSHSFFQTGYKQI